MPRNKHLNEQMRLESRRKILEIAGELFSTEGFFNVRISEIAKRAGMSSGNIYWYFPSKEDLLKAILADLFDNLAAILEEASQYPGSGLEKIKHLIELELNFMQASGKNFLVYMSILGHGGPKYIQELGFDTVQIGFGYHQRMSAIFTQAMQEGSIPLQDPNSLTAFFFSFFNGLLITYGKDMMGIPRERIVEAVLRMMGSTSLLGQP